MSGDLLNQFGGERISSRQIDELIGRAKGIVADGSVHQAEVEFLQKWLVANAEVSGHPVLNTLYRRVGQILSDGIVDEDEKTDLLETLNQVSSRDFELGEALKSTTLPLCDPFPTLSFRSQRYCFTGTFMYGERKACEGAVADRGGEAGSLTRSTNFLVIGAYATDSWKHSAFGNKIVKAAEMRSKGVPIAIVSEEHWTKHL